MVVTSVLMERRLLHNEPVSASKLSDLLILGQERDLNSERGVSCTGELPAPSDPNIVERAKIAKAKLGSRALILGHHYQRDEVIDFADITGDSFKLAKEAEASDAELIVFCGVHLPLSNPLLVRMVEQSVPLQMQNVPFVGPLRKAIRFFSYLISI